MKLYPVVHINNFNEAVAQSREALRLGADGVYLINHREYDPPATLSVLKAVKALDKKAYVGINLLAFNTTEILDFLQDYPVLPDALWHDDIRNSGRFTPGEVFGRKNDGRLCGMRLLGGVAFKYTETYTSDPDEAELEVRELESFVDVVTTSGQGTGYAASLGKLRAMRDATKKPIAVASGVTLDNISDYAGLADEVLVASSIETVPHSGIFNRGALKTIIKAAHSIS